MNLKVYCFMLACIQIGKDKFVQKITLSHYQNILILSLIQMLNFGVCK